MCVWCLSATGVQSLIITRDDLVSREHWSLTSSAFNTDTEASWEIWLFHFNAGLFKTQCWWILACKLKLNQTHHWKNPASEVDQSGCRLLPFDAETADKCLASFKRIFQDKWRPPWFFLVRLTPRCRGSLVTLRSRELWATGAHFQSCLSGRSNDLRDLKEVRLKTT